MASGGSLIEVRPGVWRSRVLVGYQDGTSTKPKQHAETYGKTAQPIGKREAERLHAEHVTKANAAQLSTSVDTFGGYLSRWTDDRSPTWKATTERRNRSIVAKIPDALSGIRLRDLKRADIQRYIDSVPPSGARRVHAVISGALADAVAGEREGLARNPATGIRLPRSNVPEANPPEDDELRLVLGAARAKGELWGDLFTFAAYTGLRRGEVCALRWADVDDLESVTVRHSIETLTKTTDGNTWALTDTKSHQNRMVPLAQPARRAIARRRELFTPNLPDPEAFVFFAKDASVPLHPDHVSKVFTAAADKAGVSVTLKDLRSYAATVLASSAGLKVAQQFLGHRDVATTARHYAGSRADAVQRGLDALNAVDQELPAIAQ